MKALVVINAVTVLLVGAGCGAKSSAPPPSGSETESTYAQRVAANYKVLSAAQSQQLVQFAIDFRACVVKRGLALGKPRVLNTKIEMGLPAEANHAQVLQLTGACGDSLGGPPPKSSLQAFQRVGDPNTVVLYLPKQCLLDPKVSAQHQ